MDSTPGRLVRIVIPGLAIAVLIAVMGCREYGIVESDSPQIRALKRLGAKVTYGMPGGYYIELQDTGVDNEDLIHFEELPDVLTVDLSATDVTDDGLRYLVAGPKHLKSLTLDDTEIGDAGMEMLKDLPGITALSLSGTQVTDRGLAHLKDGLPRLDSLKLMRCPNITDAGLKSIAEMPALSALHLADCPQITDAGLEHLAKKRNYRIIYLLNTGTTPNGAQKLARATGAPFVVDANGDPAGALAKLAR